MSAYPYSRMPPAPMAGPSKRYPLNTVNHNYVPMPKAPASPKPAEKQQKAPSSPPLTRQNSKSVPPSPPKIIEDVQQGKQFHRTHFLGEGGFARVYEVRDVRGKHLACKVVTKDSLKTKKAKTKLYAEIRIHKMLEHPNIVDFLECFEDEDNVYMTLELCRGGSLMDLLRRRRRFTEPETRFFMMQLLGACHYMHTHQVIHRDLKLGNIFLDGNQNIKVGDFGLAALIENEGERKKTICGTPNYIAPEVLFDTANGHSYEVDTWSTGVILYTLIIGRPPFQTKEVKGIYNKIKENDYGFPEERAISAEAKELVTTILASDPSQRPTIHEIVAHRFLSTGTFPPYLPETIHDAIPTFHRIDRASSQINYRNVKRASLLDDDQTSSIAVPKSTSSTSSSSGAVSKNVASTIAQQEKEFQKAVQPGSPIAALLNSARKPLVMSTAGGGGGVKESPLMRKLQASRPPVASPLGPGRGNMKRGLQGIEEEETEQHQRERAKQKELEAMKARIVAQMAEREETEDDRENLPPPPRKVVKRSVEHKAPAPAPVSKPLPPPAPVQFAVSPRDGQQLKAKLVGFEAAEYERRKLFHDPRVDPSLPLIDEKVFIVSWIDYCNKYGMGYALTDGSVGVHFNDTTSIILSADKQHFDYLKVNKDTRLPGTVYVRKSYSVEEYPENLKSKVYLLKHFERYIMDRLYGEYDYTWDDVERSRGMDWVQKYLRMKNVIVFKLSHDVLQIILSSHGLLVTQIDKEYRMTKFSLSQIMEIALRGTADEVQAKQNHKLVAKLKFCWEVLVSIRNASGEVPAPGAMEQGMTRRA
ncbi:Pkinase-domain-containing protein [Hymenopellis radicata]|nr:Pkinase-domain-containing protein [Hymenopellis radicata]